jgi:hypothetical protein
LLEKHKKNLCRQCKIALQDIRPDNPAFIQYRTSKERNETLSTSANIPFQSSSLKLILLRTFTLEARTSTFTLTLKSDSKLNFHSL